MPEERVKQLAAESEEITSQRSTLLEEIEALRKGLIKCQQHRVREITGQIFVTAHDGELYVNIDRRPLAVRPTEQSSSLPSRIEAQEAPGEH